MLKKKASSMKNPTQLSALIPWVCDPEGSPAVQRKDLLCMPTTQIQLPEQK